MVIEQNGILYSYVAILKKKKKKELTINTNNTPEKQWKQSVLHATFWYNCNVKFCQ